MFNPIQCRTSSTSEMCTHTTRWRLLFLDPTRDGGEVDENSGSTMACYKIYGVISAGLRQAAAIEEVEQEVGEAAKGFRMPPGGAIHAFI